MQHHLSLIGAEISLDVIKHGFSRADAMHCDDLVTCFGTTSQYLFKDLLLQLE